MNTHDFEREKKNCLQRYALIGLKRKNMIKYLAHICTNLNWNFHLIFFMEEKEEKEVGEKNKEEEEHNLT